MLCGFVQNHMQVKAAALIQGPIKEDSWEIKLSNTLKQEENAS